MASKNNAKNVANFRERQREEGIIRIEIYAHQDDAVLIRKLAAKLKEKRNAG